VAIGEDEDQAARDPLSDALAIFEGDSALQWAAPKRLAQALGMPPPHVP
jgi:hypothetical protein